MESYSCKCKYSLFNKKSIDLKFDFNINEEYQYVGGRIVIDDTELSLYKLQS